MSGGVKFLPMRSYAMSRLPSGPHDRVEIVIVRTAPTEIAGECVARLVARRLRIALEQRHGRHDLARRAEAALRRELVDEGLLHFVQLAVRTLEPFDGHDLAATQRVGQRRAGVMWNVVKQHGAGAAFTAVATELGAGEAELV